MSRKDYVLIAETIAQLDIEYPVKAIIAQEFARKLSTTNGNFDRARFLKACGIN
jgi:hypothetical protein